AEELGAQMLAACRERQDWMPRLAQRLAECRERTILVEREDDECAVGAITLDLVERLTDHGNQAKALLARALGDELLDPQAERLERRWQQERQLVAASLRRIDHERAQRESGIRRGRLMTTRGHVGARLQEAIDVVPEQGRRHESEERQRREASADVWGIDEDVAISVRARVRGQRRLGIGDGDEAPAGSLGAKGVGSQPAAIPFE